MHPTIGAPKYVRKILEDFKKDIDNKIILGDFKTALSKMDRSSKQNINKDIVKQNDTSFQVDSADIYIETFIPENQNGHYFQMPMEHFQR